MLHVPLLGLLVEGWKTGVVEKVVRQVVDDVASDTATEGDSAHVPVGVEDGVGKLPKWKGECNEECWRHDETISIHWQVVVNAVKEEMSSKSEAVVRKVAE